MQILRVIAEADASDPRKLPNKYEICRTLDPELGTEPTILAAVSDLDEAGLIYARYVDEHARGGSPSRHYDLTLQGFQELVGGIGDLGWKKIGFRKGARFSMLARRYRDTLPEILGLWERFEREGVAGLIQNSMFAVCQTNSEEFDDGIRTLKEWKAEWLKQDRTRRPEDYAIFHQERTRLGFLERFYLHLDTANNKDHKRFLAALSRDSELKPPYLAYLNKRKTEEEEYLKRIEAEIQQVQKD
jgi:hypothetical protein